MRAATIILCGLLAAPLCAAPEARTMKLCDALDQVGDGQALEIEVSGIYAVGLEAQVLYDPEEPACRIDVQPATWVTFDPGMADDAELEKVLGTSRRAYVTFRGTLVGPAPIPPDDPALDPRVAMVNRLAARHRFGHLGGFRTQLTVHAISNVRPVPKSVPWEARWNQPPRKETNVIDAPVPRYPDLAWRAGVSGVVELDVTVLDGVPSVKNVGGDRLLSSEAAATVRQWRFAKGTSTSFRTKFIYKLEKRLNTADANPRVEMHLPSEVTIIAPENGW
jgi:hypothetical protein